MESIKVICTNNGKSKIAEVLNHSDKYLKVVFEGTDMIIELFRKDILEPYTGFKAGLEFEYEPE